MAAFSSWHARHADADAALAGVEVLIGHVELEAYSVLTRLPGPLRAPPALVGEFLERRFPGERLQLPATARRGLIGRLAAAGIAGGAVYDALIAACAEAHGALLVTLDERAQRTYDRLGTATRVL